MSKRPYKTRTSCCLCDSPGLEKVCDITKLPYRSPNVGDDPGGEETLPKGDHLVPLALYMCSSCFHIQLADIVDPELQYTHYTYNTSISVGLAEHFKSSISEIISAMPVRSESPRILEIGSNDGTFLRYFKDLNWTVLGVEPATGISAAAEESGVPTLNAFFSLETANAIAAKQEAFDVVAANYVFANIESIGEVVEGIAAVLKEDGVFVFETQYGLDVIENFLIDTIYHEHISYFNVKPLIALFKRFDMTVVDVQRIPTKGGSLRVFVKKAAAGPEQMPSVGELLKMEAETGFHSFDRLADFSDRVAHNVRDMSVALSSSMSIAGFGASVGTMTLLHLYDLTDRVKFICDDKPMHDALCGPGYEIPIVSGETLYEKSVDAVVLFAWRYANNIVPKHQAYLDKGGQFIVPLPAVRSLIEVSKKV